MDDKLFTHPSSLLIGPFQTRDKTFIFQFSHFATLIDPILDPTTHNRPFADKRDKVGIDGVPKTLRHHEAIRVSAPNEFSPNTGLIISLKKLQIFATIFETLIYKRKSCIQW